MIQTTKYLTEIFDYQKTGYFNNMLTGLPYADTNKLITFLSPHFATMGTIAFFKLIGINPVIEKDLGAYIGLVIPTAQGYYYNAEVGTFSDKLPCGVYYLYCMDTLGQEFRTGIFNLNLTGYPPNSGAGLGDFSPLDYNDDFFKTIT